MACPEGIYPHSLQCKSRGVAQPGSASALGAEGRWFKSSHPDHFFITVLKCLDRLSIRLHKIGI